MCKTTRFIILSSALLLGVSHAQVTTNAIHAELERIQDDRDALRSTIVREWVSASNIRGTSDILYSCLLTLLACIYTVLHLNVPPRGAGAMHMLLAKCLWGFAALVAPEIVLFYASSQYFEARGLARFLSGEETRQAKKLRKGGVTQGGEVVEAAVTASEPEAVEVAASAEAIQTAPESTEGDQASTAEKSTPTESVPLDPFDFNTKHGFFLTMGGLQIMRPSVDGEIPAALSLEGIKMLAKINLDALKISPLSIDDRSKADTIQKALVLLQVTWMATQCIARTAYGLPICLLELHTMVHVICALAMYGFWFKVSPCFPTACLYFEATKEG